MTSDPDDLHTYKNGRGTAGERQGRAGKKHSTAKALTQKSKENNIFLTTIASD